MLKNVQTKHRDLSALTEMSMAKKKKEERKVKPFFRAFGTELIPEARCIAADSETIVVTAWIDKAWLRRNRLFLAALMEQASRE
jgi:hypothetical protein